MDIHGAESIGKTATAANEFIRWVVEQTDDGCPSVNLAAGIGLALDKMADADPGSKKFRTLLATLLKEYAI